MPPELISLLLLRRFRRSARRAARSRAASSSLRRRTVTCPLSSLCILTLTATGGLCICPDSGGILVLMLETEPDVMLLRRSRRWSRLRES